MEKINTVSIDDTQLEMSEEENKIAKLSEVYWKDYLADKNYNKDVSKMCDICIKEQKETHGRITIPCKGPNNAKNISPEAYQDLVSQGFSEEELKDLDAVYNPFTYMSVYQDYGNIHRKFEHRFYQEMILTCSARSKVVRMGRRCLPSYSKVLLPDFSQKKIKDLKVGDVVVSKKGMKTTFNPIVGISVNGTKPVYRVILEDDKKVDVTINHPLRALKDNGKEDWVSIETGLQVGDYVSTIVIDSLKESSSFDYQKITSISYLDSIETFDLEIANDHNFFTDGILVSNTGKSQSIAMLAIHRAMMNEKYRILLVSPYAVQTEEIINNIKEICASLPENPIQSSKQTPAHKITFHNGSVLMGFTASTDGNQIRGQPGDLIILDETDDIPEKAITSIMGIKMQNPEVEVWRSGTPKGERNLHKAEQDILSKCFHYPSYVNPRYSDEMDISLRAEMGEGVGYVEEVLAEIATASNAVFQTLFINRATLKMEFTQAIDVLGDRKRYIVFIGVDWNHDKVGSRILVVAYDKINPQFTIIDKEIVAVEGFTQAESVEKIIALNRKYNCDHVFVDQGFGAMQVATLKKFALSQVGIAPKGSPDLKLLDVTPIDYGSSTEVVDPVTGATYRTPTKQMAVMNCVEMLERDMLTLHPKKDSDIIAQLKNYIEKSRNKGRVVYGYLSKRIGDHDLDALMIGLFGMSRLYSTLHNPTATDALITFVGKSPDENVSRTDSLSSDDFLIGFGKRSTTANTSRSWKNDSSRRDNFKRNTRNSW